MDWKVATMVSFEVQNASLIHSPSTGKYRILWQQPWLEKD